MKMHKKNLFTIDFNGIFSLTLFIIGFSCFTYASPITVKPHHHQQHQVSSYPSSDSSPFYPAQFSSSPSSSSLSSSSSSSSLSSSSPFYSHPAALSDRQSEHSGLRRTIEGVNTRFIKSDDDAHPSMKRASVIEEKSSSSSSTMETDPLTNSDLNESNEDSYDTPRSVYTSNTHGPYGNHHMIAELQRFLTKLDSHVKLAGRPRYGRSIRPSDWSAQSKVTIQQVPSG